VRITVRLTDSLTHKGGYPMVAGDQLTLMVHPGEALTVTLGAGASATLIELGSSNVPLTPLAVSRTPSVFGPFNTTKTFLLQAAGGTVTYALGPAEASQFGVRVVQQSGVAVSGAADTNENILATIPIPAGLMGVNGSLRVTTIWSVTNNANAKTARVRLGGIGGTAFWTVALASVLSGKGLCVVMNRGAQNSQVAADPNVIGLATSAVAVTTGAIDTSVAQDLVITGQKATGGDTMTLEAYCVEVVQDLN
jgi:hypothetical protein